MQHLFTIILICYQDLKNVIHKNTFRKTTGYMQVNGAILPHPYKLYCTLNNRYLFIFFLLDRKSIKYHYCTTEHETVLLHLLF